MILEVSSKDAEAILGAMKGVALAHGQQDVSDTDLATIAAAGQIVLALDGFEPEALPELSPAQLAARIDSEDEARLAVQMLAVMSLVDGNLDAEKTKLVCGYAKALGIADDHVHVLAEAAAGEVAAAAACMIRKNAESFPRLDTSGVDTDAVAPFLPYRDGNDDLALEQRYATLGELPAGSFGRAFFDHFKRNKFTFPGNPAGLAEGFTTPHDSSHVLSGYSTSQQGELCVSTFIGAMHPDHPMAAEVLPVLFSWHLGIKLNEIAGSYTGAYDPRKFWTAWERGSAIEVDLVASDWDFWAATEVPLQELRDSYGLPPVDESLLA